MIVEVAEEDDEGDAVTEHERVHGIWEVTLCEKVVTRVQQEHHKLHLEGEMLRQIILHRLARAHTHVVRTGSAHQLQGCEVFFPPQILLHVRADGSQAVVGIHDDMDEGVEQADEECCRRCTKTSEQWQINPPTCHSEDQIWLIIITQTKATGQSSSQ